MLALLFIVLATSTKSVGGTVTTMTENSTSTTANMETMHYPTVRLRDGNVMPQIGVCVGDLDTDETLRTLRWAFELGVRLVDTAAMYENEEEVHDAVVEKGLARDSVFIVSKLDEGEHGYEDAYENAIESLEERLQTSYFDLYLIHSPDEGKIVETWDALVDLQKDGLAHSIGVSNFGIQHLEAIRKAGRPLPVVNQIEMHPLIYQRRKDLVEYCKKYGITIMAFGSLFEGFTEFFDQPTLLEISERAQKNVPQILLRWAIDHGFVIIPTSSSSKQRQRDNYNILDFELTADELNKLDELSNESAGLYGKLDEITSFWDFDVAPVDIGDIHLAARIRMKRKHDDDDDDDIHYPDADQVVQEDEL